MAHRQPMRADTPHGEDPLNQSLSTGSAELTERPRHTAPSGFLTIDELIQRHTRAVLDACNGNKSQAARVLGIDRRSLYRLLAREAA